MISIGSRPFPEAVGGLHAATDPDRRIAPTSRTAPTSRLDDTDAESAQPQETLRLGALAVQALPEDGPSATEKPRDEPERALRVASTEDARHAAQDQTPHLDARQDPIPPLRSFVEIPMETSAEIQRLRAEQSADQSSAAPEIGLRVDTLRALHSGPDPSVDIHR